MKLRLFSIHMLRNKAGVCFVAALFLLLSSLSIRAVSAQQTPVLNRVYPERGSLGEEVNLLLRGDGFQSLGVLRGVQISGQEIPVLDYEAISSQVIRVLILIPQQTVTGETEISFLFDNMGLDAYFIITEGNQDISPFIYQINPQEGQVDTEMRLFFEGTRLLELGQLGGVIIGGGEIPVIDDNMQSDQSIVIYLPLETPTGETEISVFFENYSFREFFFVSGQKPAEPGVPALLRLTPQEGLVDADIKLVLEGQGFFELGELVRLTIAGIDIPILDYASESNESMVIAVHLPPELPTGETRIAFFYENGIFEEFFFVRGQEPGPIAPGIPILRRLNPPEGKMDTEIELLLEGKNFFELGDLIGVSIGGIEMRVLDHEIRSNETIVMRLYLPEDMPRGQQVIEFFFENARFKESFFVSAPSQPGFPATGVIVVVIVVAGGILGRRFFRGRRSPNEQMTEKTTRPQAKIDFVVGQDPGTQSVKQAERSPKMDIDLRFEIEVDQGEQTIEMAGNSIISRE